MAFFNLKSQLAGCFAASVLSFLLTSCQGTKKDDLFGQLFPQEETREQVPVPAWFTEAKARQMGSQVDSIVQALHKKRGFNGAVLVSKYDQVVYKGSFGYADFYHKDSLNTQTAFQLASVSKQFTAMAVMILHEQGELQYDDSVQQYLPEFPYKGITIRQLLTHRSGLPNYTYFSDKLWPDRHKPLTNPDVVQLMAENKPAAYYQPNTHFDYSNTGYALLAAIVAKVADMPFDTFLQEEIFGPLQMSQTFTYTTDFESTHTNVATGHTGRRQKRTSDYLDTVLGDKGVFSTVEDLYKWDQALYTNQLVQPETLHEAFKGSRTDKKKDEDYGFGWRIRPMENGDTAVYHAGLWHGYTTYLLRNPTDHSAIIVLSNLPNSSLKLLKDALQHYLYPAQPSLNASVEIKPRKAHG